MSFKMQADCVLDLFLDEKRCFGTTITADRRGVLGHPEKVGGPLDGCKTGPV